jgi:lipoprotein signal peptidase
MTTRLVTLLCAAGATVIVDAVTKWMPHPVTVENRSSLPVWAIVAIALCLVGLGVTRSRLVAAGSGLLLGGLLGNDGQVLLQGYATDWISVGSWFTNIADVAGGAGFLCCCIGYLLPVRSDHSATPRVSPGEH